MLRACVRCDNNDSDTKGKENLVKRSGWQRDERKTIYFFIEANVMNPSFSI